MQRTPSIVRTALALVVPAVFLLPGAARGEAAPAEAVRAAQEGLAPFLNALPGERRQGCDGAKLGEPFRVYTITSAALDAYRAGDPASSLISPTGMWLFPVVAGDRSRFLLTVDGVDGAWRAVSLGQAGLAAELDRLLLQWPRARGYDPLLVSVFPAATHLFTIPEKDGQNLTPFVFGPEGKERAGPNPYSATAELARTVSGLKSAAGRAQP